MELLGWLVMGIGGIATLVGTIWLIFAAFRESILWGLCALLIPFVSLIFAVTHWAEAKRPALLLEAGALLSGLGRAMAR
jgi:hypothetical protein